MPPLYQLPQSKTKYLASSVNIISGLSPQALNAKKQSGVAFFYARPEFTYRHDFVEVLTPIFQARLQKGQEFEFDVQPEKLTVTAGLSKFRERVVMIRSTPTHSENAQQVLIDTFSETNEDDIKSLRKYMFVPIAIAGDNDKTTLQGVLRTQHNFRTSVYHFIVTNANEFGLKFQVPLPDVLENTATDNSTDTIMQDTTDSSPEIDPGLDTNESGIEDQQQQELEPLTESYSLREWFYDLLDGNGENLIHAAYPSTETNKIFILCERVKTTQVLQILHNRVEIMDDLFLDEALTRYFGKDKDYALVFNHPCPTAELSTYASKLASYATTSNPQDVPNASPPSQNQRGPKRMRHTKRDSHNYCVNIVKCQS